MEPVNRIKIVLFEKKRTSKWLSEQMGVTPSTVSTYNGRNVEAREAIRI